MFHLDVDFKRLLVLSKVSSDFFFFRGLGFTESGVKEDEESGGRALLLVVDRKQCGQDALQTLRELACDVDAERSFVERFV